MTRHDLSVPEARHPWERQHNETNPAWDAFVIYRDLDRSERSQARVCSETGKDNALIERWSKKHRWVARVAAWDAELDRRKVARRLDEVERMGERQASNAMALEAAVLRPVHALIRQIRNGHNGRSVDEILAEMHPHRLLELSVLSARVWPRVAMMEREARGVTGHGSQAQPGAMESAPPVDARGPSRQRDHLLAVYEKLAQIGFDPTQPMRRHAIDPGAE